MHTLPIVLLLSMLPASESPVAAGLAALDPVPFTQVRIEDKFWAPRIETNRTVTLPHNIKSCEETGRIRNFAIAAGLEQGNFEGIYFNDSDVYKMLEGAAYTLAVHPDPDLDRKIDEIIAVIAAAQQPDGYLNTYYTLVEKGKRWTNLPAMHELYCSGHLFEAAVAHWQATGKRAFLDVARKLADHIDATFGPEKQHGVPGHEEIELALVKLYRATGEKRYLDLSKFFLDERGRYCGRKPYGDYCQDHLPVREQSDIVGHAVRAMYLYSGVADVARLTGDRGFIDAMERVWQNVALKKMYVTGGIGPSASNEGFTVDYDLPNDSAYAETCASIGMALWNHRLLLLHGEGRFGDVLEQVLYNGLLSGVSLSGDRFFYVNPLASRGAHHRQPWFGCACCPTNVVRFLPSLPGSIYATKGDSIWVNLYIAGSARIPIGNGEVGLVQETRYPWDGKVKISVDPGEPRDLEIALRIPGWCREAAARAAGEALDVGAASKGYLRVRRTWKKGDAIELDLPMPVRRIEANPAVKDDRGRLAIARGPIVYCLEAVDHDAPVRSIAVPRRMDLRAEERPDLLGGVVVVRGAGLAAGSDGWEDALYREARPARRVEVTAIPYYSWDHRAPGAMVVWVPESTVLAEAPPVPSRAGKAKATASHCWQNDTTAAMNDGVLPANSNDQGIPRFTWWPHQGTAEWASLEFPAPIEVSRAEVYWFDDAGGCRLPESWRLLWKDGAEWKPVTGAPKFGIDGDAFNEVRFDPVRTAGLRIEVKLRPGASGGILEWRVP